MYMSGYKRSANRANNRNCVTLVPIRAANYPACHSETSQVATRGSLRQPRSRLSFIV